MKQLLQENNTVVKNENDTTETQQIDIISIFQAMMSLILDDIKDIYLKTAITYNPKLTLQERQTKFSAEFVNSVKFQKLTQTVSKLLSKIAKEKLHKSKWNNEEEHFCVLQSLSSQLIVLLLAFSISYIILIRKIFCHRKLFHVASQAFNETRIDTKADQTSENKASNLINSNQYAAPMRDIEKLEIAIEVFINDEDFDDAHKLITQLLMLTKSQLDKITDQNQNEIENENELVIEELSFRLSKYYLLSAKVMYLQLNFQQHHKLSEYDVNRNSLGYHYIRQSLISLSSNNIDNAFFKQQLTSILANSNHNRNDIQSIRVNAKKMYILNQKTNTYVNALMTRVITLCECDKLEIAEPLMKNQLLSLANFNNDTMNAQLESLFDYDHITLLSEAKQKQIVMLDGLFEHLMEEVETAQDIWNNVLLSDSDADANSSSTLMSNLASNNTDFAFQMWQSLLQLSLEYNCIRIANIVLEESQIWFEKNKTYDYKLDTTLLNHQMFMYQKEYRSGFNLLGTALIDIDDHNPKLWLKIGQTYYQSYYNTVKTPNNKEKIDGINSNGIIENIMDFVDNDDLIQGIQAFERHLLECQKIEIKFDLIGSLWLIKLYLEFENIEIANSTNENKGNNNNSNNTINYQQGTFAIKALTVIQACLKQIENDSENDYSEQMWQQHQRTALKYMLELLQSQCCLVCDDISDALSIVAKASKINPHGSKLWKHTENCVNSLQNNCVEN